MTTKRAEEFEGKMWMVLRKKSWGKHYISVNGGKDWHETWARKVAFYSTPSAEWIPA